MKKRHRLLTFLILISVMTAGVVGYRGKAQEAESAIQQGIASRIIRFHVRANSDSERDQALKLAVKDAVVTYLRPMLSQSKSVEESRQLLADHAEEIKAVAEETLRSMGSSQTVQVYFENSYFPMKSYADMTFPPGVYEAFRIDIGESVGKNWWCVLYPPLCFVDATYGILPEESKQTLENVLTEDEYNAITKTQCVYRFKYLTFLNFLFE